MTQHIWIEYRWNRGCRNRKIGKMEVKNRLVMSPMGTNSAFTNGRKDAQEVDYFIERASMTQHIWIEYRWNRGCRNRRIAKGIWKCISSSTGTDLTDNFRSISMYAIADRGQCWQYGEGIHISFHRTLCDLLI